MDPSKRGREGTKYQPGNLGQAKDTFDYDSSRHPYGCTKVTEGHMRVDRALSGASPNHHRDP